VLKNDFSTTFSCKKPNDFDGRFFKTWLFNTLLRMLAAADQRLCQCAPKTNGIKYAALSNKAPWE
jgi:hypothetical protein